MSNCSISLTTYGVCCAEAVLIVTSLSLEVFIDDNLAFTLMDVDGGLGKREHLVPGTGM